MSNSAMTTDSTNQEVRPVEFNAGTQQTSGNKDPGLEAQDPGTGLDELRGQLTAEHDRYLRLAADFDNFKKRTARETERRALEHKDAFIRELLPVVDNLERALAGDTAAGEPALRDGVKLILQQLFLLLRKHGLDSELSLGQRFDPHRHEAMRTRSAPEFADQTVIEVWERGWRRAGELFRPAKVVVNDLNTSQAD